MNIRSLTGAFSVCVRTVNLTYFLQIITEQIRTKHLTLQRDDGFL